MAYCKFTFVARTSPPFPAKACFRGVELKHSSGPQFLKTSPFTSVQLKGRSGRRKLSISATTEVPDFLPATWTKRPVARPIGPSFDSTAEEATLRQLDALQMNDQPYADHGVEVLYRFAGIDPLNFQRSRYFGRPIDLSKFDYFTFFFQNSTYRVLLCHEERRVLSSLFVDEHCFKQRVWIRGARPGEEEIFEFTLSQRVGGNWDGYWLTDSLHHDGLP